MEDTILTELCNTINQLGGVAPAIPSPELYEVLTLLFTEEEAVIAAKMSPGAAPARALAEKLSRAEEEIVPLLESMADKGIVLTRKKDGVVLYRLMPLMPGIFEFQFMRGSDTERDRRLARLFKKYFDMALPMVQTHLSTVKDVASFSRVIPVEKTIQAGQNVYTFDQLSQYIDSADAIAVGHCYCRQYAHLLGEESCEAPKETCMNFGPGAAYTSQRGITRMISKEEAYEILKACEESGLVHLSSNTSEYLEYLCNCCGCHCGSLKLIKETGAPIWAATSGYIARIDAALCEGCGTCMENCQLEAITLGNEETAVIEDGRCVGCGVCAGLCPVEAIAMVSLEDFPTPPGTARDLRSSIFNSLMGKRADK
ncbi:ATP-binding protein [Thermodesulfobacteriota bacterium]